MGATFVGLVTSPYLMGLILLAIPLGMFFGAVPRLGGKLGSARYSGDFLFMWDGVDLITEYFVELLFPDCSPIRCSFFVPFTNNRLVLGFQAA